MSVINTSYSEDAKAIRLLINKNKKTPDISYIPTRQLEECDRKYGRSTDGILTMPSIYFADLVTQLKREMPSPKFPEDDPFNVLLNCYTA